MQGLELRKLPHKTPEQCMKLSTFLLETKMTKMDMIHQ